MNCDKAKQILMDLALDEASAQERAGVQTHVRECAACRAALADLQLTRRLLVEGMPQEEVPRRIAFATAPQPASWTAAVRAWLTRPAFALPLGVAAGIALLAGVMAVAQARITVGQGRWELAFGRPSAVAPAPRPSAMPAPLPASGSLITREQAAVLIATAVSESEQRQRAESRALWQAVAQRLDQRYSTALMAVAQQMNYLERTQNVLYKETGAALRTVASRLPAEKGDRP